MKIKKYSHNSVNKGNGELKQKNFTITGLMSLVINYILKHFCLCSIRVFHLHIVGTVVVNPRVLLAFARHLKEEFTSQIILCVCLKMAS